MIKDDDVDVCVSAVMLYHPSHTQGSTVHTHPKAVGVNLHGALEGEEAGEGGVHVVQDELVGVSLVVMLDETWRH